MKDTAIEGVTFISERKFHFQPSYYIGEVREPLLEICTGFISNEHCHVECHDFDGAIVIPLIILKEKGELKIGFRTPFTGRINILY